MTGPSALTADEHAILAYLAATDAGHVSLRGMFPADRAVVPREEFGPAEWERWLELYFASSNLLTLGLVDGVAADGGEHPNRFRITEAGRAVLASAQSSTTNEG